MPHIIPLSVPKNLTVFEHNFLQAGLRNMEDTTTDAQVDKLCRGSETAPPCCNR